MFCNILTVFQLIIFGILLPTADLSGDVNFSFKAFYTRNPLIGCLMITPVIFNMLFNVAMWRTTNFDSRKEKRFTWMLVLMNLWPQYQSLKILISIFRKEPMEQWKPKNDEIAYKLAYIEPFVEAIPQYFISFCVFSLLYFRDAQSAQKSIAAVGWCNISLSGDVWSRNESKLTKVFGDTTLGVSNDIMYPLSISISFLTGIKSVVGYVHDGPIKITSKINHHSIE